MGSEVVRFLVAGGSAAAINWLARIALSQVMPFEAALLVAYTIGMAVGFWLYRVFVFRKAAGPIRGQIAVFLAVNAVGAVVVLAVSSLVIALAGAVLPGVPAGVAEAIGHGLGIGVGAVTNYVGHRLLTFGAASRLRTAEAGIL